MRRATSDQSILKNSKDEFVGICLGYDYTSEHEWGIDDLRRDFGIPESSRETLGAESRTVTVVPGDLKFFRHFQHSYLVYQRSFRKASMTTTEEAKLFDDRMECYDPDRWLHTAWSGNDFGIRILNDIDNYLEALYGSLIAHDAMFFLRGKSNPFGGTGLMICIRSRMDPEVLQRMADGDRDYFDRMDAFAATGIVEKLKAAGKKYYYLGPSWADESKKELRFYLNPADQQNNNAGYFTLKDLEDWILNKGRIPRGAKRRARVG